MNKAKRPARPFRNTKRDAGKFIESILKAYDPDREFKIGQIANPVVEFWKQVDAGRAQVESARILEVNAWGGYRVRHLNNAAELKEARVKAAAEKGRLQKLVDTGVRFREAAAFTPEEKAACVKLLESAKFREDFQVSDQNAGSANPFDEFTPIMGGPFSHQQYLHDFLDGLAKSFEAYNHSPYAHQIVRLTTSFVLGRGVSYKAKDQLVQERFAAWWKKADMDHRLETWSDCLSRDGELIVRRFKNPVTKELFLRWIGPSTVWEFVTDIEDIETVYYLHQQYPAAYQVLYGAPAGAKYDPSKFDSTKYIVNQIPYDEVYCVKINVGPDEKRGRSDIFCILGWLKRHKDFQTGQVLKAIVQSVFAWKNKLAGKQTDVDAFIQKFGTSVPDFGSLWTENEASTLEPMVADAKGAGDMSAPGIENTIAVGSGIPKEYLGSSEHASRSTAVIGSEPGIKKFQSRQLLLGRFLKKIAADWFANEVARGAIPASQPGDDPELGVVLRWLQKAMKRLPLLAAPIDQVVKALTGATLMVPTDGEIEFGFPEIAIEDRGKKIQDLITAKDERVITHRDMSEAIAKELGKHDYSYEATQDQIKEDEAASIAPLYAQPEADPNAPPKPGEPAAPEVGPKKAGGLSGQEKQGVKQNDRR